MKRKAFKAALLGGHKEAAVEVPFDPGQLWNADSKPLWKGRRGFEVNATLNGFHFESCVVPRQKHSFMLVDANVIKSTGVSIGDEVKASIELASQ